jgi:hypothetical protein
MGEMIGKGPLSLVKFVKNKIMGELVAMKIIQKREY